MLLSGRAAVAEAVGTPDQRVVRVHGPGRFLGDLGMLTGQPAYATSIVADPGEVLAIIGAAQLLIMPVIAAGARVRAVAAAALALAHLVLCDSFNFDFVYGRPNWMDESWGIAGSSAWMLTWTWSRPAARSSSARRRERPSALVTRLVRACSLG